MTHANVAASIALFVALAAGFLSMLPAQALGGAFQDISVTPEDLSFGAAPVGAPDDPLNVEVENGPPGVQDLTVSTPSITGATPDDYSITSDGCAPYPRALHGGETCTLEVTFQPAAIGARSATLNIPSNDPDESNVAVSLTGEGEFPANDDAYYPSGPRAFVDEGKLDGWELCFTGLYNGSESLDTVLTQCDGDPLLLAGGPTGSSTLTVLAAARRADVIFDTGQSNDPHNANGSGWYYNDNWSWGFAKQGDPINRNQCDGFAAPHPDLRLCWHTFGGGGFLSGGYRAGAVDELNFSEDYTRYIYQAAADLALGVEPGKRKIEVGEKAKFEAKVRNVGFLPASDVEVCIAGAGGALEPTNQCKTVGELAPDARATKNFKLEALPEAAGEKFTLNFTARGAGVETVARQTKVTVKPT